MRPSVRRLLPALAAALALAACSDRDKGPPPVASVATVGGKPITVEAFGRELAFARRTSAGVQPRTPEEEAAFRRATLEDLIDRTIVLDAAREAGLTVPADRVERELLRLKAEYHGGSFDEALAEGQLSQQELQDRTRERLLVEKYFVEQVFSRVAVIDSEIERYYSEHPEEFEEPEKVRASQIVTRTQEEARRVLAELRRGMRFDDAARRFSLSPDAKVGGDLGWFARGTMPEVFDQTCFSLPVGRMSEVVASDYGFHIFKVIDKRSAGRRSLESVRGDIEAKLLRLKQEEAQRTALESLRAKAEIRIDEAALEAMEPAS